MPTSTLRPLQGRGSREYEHAIRRTLEENERLRLANAALLERMMTMMTAAAEDNDDYDEAMEELRTCAAMRALLIEEHQGDRRRESRRGRHPAERRRRDRIVPRVRGRYDKDGAGRGGGHCPDDDDSR